MAKYKGAPEIGYRMAEELVRLFGSPTEAVRQFKCARNCVYEWSTGVVPGGYALAKLHNCGGDVLYVLTGKKEDKNAVEVVHGRWEGIEFDMFYKCSNCGLIVDHVLSDYCPNCGADMRERSGGK